MATKQQSQNPFWDMDFTKMMADYKVPGMDMDALMAAQRKNMEALSQANRLAYEGMQAVATRQAEILRQSMEEDDDGDARHDAAGAPEDKVAQQAEVMRAQFEEDARQHARAVEMVAKSNTEAAEVINQASPPPPPPTAQLEEIKASRSEEVRAVRGRCRTGRLRGHLPDQSAGREKAPHPDAGARSHPLRRPCHPARPG